MLCSIEGDIGVVAVAGMYRTGKSYLLNRMILDRSSGFGVGSTVNACTKGLWIWGTPMEARTKDKKKVSLLVVDSEGIAATDEDSNHDMKIFSLAILLSSYFLYNSQNSIDENALLSMNLVLNITSHIQLNSNSSPEDVEPEELGKYFPSFLWIVRDFSLKLTNEDGEEVTLREYLENALKEAGGISPATEEKNRIRKLIKSYFLDRDCVTMVRPITDESKLLDLENIDMSELKLEFLLSVLLVRNKVIGNMRVKLINGKPISGLMLAHLALTYVEAINEGAVPNLESSWTYVCQSESM